MLSFVISVVIVSLVTVFNLWKNHSTGWVHTRHGPFADRKTRPAQYWGCQILIVALAIVLISFGYWIAHNVTK